MNILNDQIQDLVIPILNEEGVEFVSLQVRGSHGNRIVKVVIDTEDGVTLDTCTRVSRRISDMLDIEDVIPGKYRLEVSSPGVDRPLRTIRDFERNLNRDVELRLEEGEGPHTISGKLLRVSEDTVELQLKRETANIPLSRIKQGKLRLPW